MARIAGALNMLRTQVQAAAPKAPKAEFGWIASDAHSQQNPSSDHESDARGIVHALDIPHYPKLGLDTYKLFDHFRAIKDKRIKYCISNRKIFGDEDYGRRNGRKAWTNYPYNGTNPHDHHIHVSVNKAAEDDAEPWDIGALGSGAVPGEPEPTTRPQLKIGSTGDLVRWVQLLIMTDGDYGPATQAAVKRFQREQGSVDNDGIVGKYTWDLLEKLAKAKGVPLPEEMKSPPLKPEEPPPIVTKPPATAVPPALPEPPPELPSTTPTTPAQRLAMAEQILQFEARRDGAGRLVVYNLPAGDGGGSYEVAGINEKYHAAEAAELRALIKAGKHDEAEARAQEIIASYTDVAALWTDDPGVEFYLRDCVFNRGPTGAMRILQRAVSTVDKVIKDDGSWGPITQAATLALTPAQLLARLRVARENYERVVAGRNESSQFWKGLVSRWDKALAAAGKFHSEANEQGEIT